MQSGPVWSDVRHNVQSAANEACGLHVLLPDCGRNAAEPEETQGAHRRQMGNRDLLVSFQQVRMCIVVPPSKYFLYTYIC